MQLIEWEVGEDNYQEQIIIPKEKNPGSNQPVCDSFKVREGKDYQIVGEYTAKFFGKDDYKAYSKLRKEVMQSRGDLTLLPLLPLG